MCIRDRTRAWGLWIADCGMWDGGIRIADCWNGMGDVDEDREMHLFILSLGISLANTVNRHKTSFFISLLEWQCY